MRKIMFVGLMALTGQLMAGLFFLQLGNPEANAQAREANAVLVIKAVGCQDPATAKVIATATGMLEGKLQTIPLELMRLKEPGNFALTRQWPKQGKWVIEIVGKNPYQFTNTLVAAGPESVDRLHAKSATTPFTRADIESLLE